MKKKVSLIYYTLISMLFAGITNPAFAAAAPLTLRKTIIKFALSMGVVIVSAIVLYCILLIYKRIQNGKAAKMPQKRPTFETPQTTEEAVDFFINKNKL
ncbi:MAG: hypothetical protein LKG27_08465 [Clostridiaceae bacterium]|nr:hypothetical protein [Clostridiaceae bacterium]